MMELPENKLPVWYPAPWAKPKVNERSARLIREYAGKIVPYSALPAESQLALLQYMAVDGEAWEFLPEMEDAVEENLRQFSDEERHQPDVNRAWERSLRVFLPYFVKNYGDEKFGYIEAIPLRVLIESVMEDNELKRDWGGLEGWRKYHEWYKGDMKHSASSAKLWPVILSSFEDETLQDGWNRFHRYVERGLESCPAIWFPGGEDTYQGVVNSSL